MCRFTYNCFHCGLYSIKWKTWGNFIHWLSERSLFLDVGLARKLFLLFWTHWPISLLDLFEIGIRIILKMSILEIPGISYFSVSRRTRHFRKISITQFCKLDLKPRKKPCTLWFMGASVIVDCGASQLGHIQWFWRAENKFGISEKTTCIINKKKAKKCLISSTSEIGHVAEAI
jgi:hypothetical protein